MKKIFFPLILLILITSCSREDNNNELFINDNKIYKIPIIVHVVHNGESIGTGPNISYEQIVSQIEVLNEDFRREINTNGYNENGLGVDTQIEFYLAKNSPNEESLVEPGVNRVFGGRVEWPKGLLGNPIENVLKPQTIWNPKKYLNIWIVNFGGFIGRNLLGYAQFPSDSGLVGLNTNGGNAETDGIVIGYKYFGSSEKGNFPNLYAPFDLGRTTTHEVGHWLGLRHIWGDGDCDTDDFCNDTPLSSKPTEGCPGSKETCGSFDMIENYMDYSDDVCLNTFTSDQKQRMLTVLKKSPRRKELVSY